MRESLIFFENLKKQLEPKVKDLLEDFSFKEKLSVLKKLLSESYILFQETGSLVFCEVCAKKGIKCCGEGLEWKLSKEEFFINLCLFSLEGSSFSFPQVRDEDCLFLGEKGCVLKLAPLFCRNFFCRELSDFLGIERLKLLQNSLEFFYLVFELSEYLKTKRIF